VHLQREHALRGPFSLPLVDHLLVDRLRHQLTVDEVRQLGPLGDDPVFVPVAGADHLLQVLGAADRLAGGLFAGAIDPGPLAALGEDAAAAFLVEDAGVGGAAFEIGLVASHDEIAEVAAAILDAAVASGQAIREDQFEVVEEPLPPDQERVALGRILGGRLPDDRALLHPPEFGLPLPAGQAHPVENRHEAVLGGAAERRPHNRQQAPHDREPSDSQSGTHGGNDGETGGSVHDAALRGAG
jgi:hypothetical protein